MGFIDYQGDKEDRYSEVVEFAKAQQEEEFRRINDARISAWVNKRLNDERYSDVPINDLLKYIMVRYKKMCTYRDTLIKADSSDSFNTDRFWTDFVIYCVVNTLKYMMVSRDKALIIYQSVLGKVFKEKEFTPPEKHYESFENNEKYRRYFMECFDVAQEKQFWKWIGKCGQSDKENLIKLIESYEQLQIL